MRCLQRGTPLGQEALDALKRGVAHQVKQLRSCLVRALRPQQHLRHACGRQISVSLACSSL